MLICMARKPFLKDGSPNKAGRPHKQIDKRLFEECCFLQCTQMEIESLMDTDIDTIRTWAMREYGIEFSEAYKKFSNGGKKSLRRHQFDLAKKNTAMAIWLGKNYLGQKDTVEVHTLDLPTLKDEVEKGNLSQT